jgi:hypothetical protein
VVTQGIFYLLLANAGVQRQHIQQKKQSGLEQVRIGAKLKDRNPSVSANLKFFFSSATDILSREKKDMCSVKTRFPAKK